jgi:parvulin-like peptidyl-prolyl isomerase
MITLLNLFNIPSNGGKLQKFMFSRDRIKSVLLWKKRRFDNTISQYLDEKKTLLKRIGEAMQEKKKSIVFLVLVLSCIGLFLLSCGDRGAEEQASQEGIASGGATPGGADAGIAPGQLPGQGMPGLQEGGAESAFQNFMINVSPQTVVAKVNDTEIKAWIIKDVAKIIGEQIRQQVGVIQPEMEEQLGKKALDAVVRSELIYQQAVKEDISATEEEVDKIIESIKVKFPDEEKFQDFLKMTGCSQDELRNEERKKIVINKYLGEKIVPLVKLSEQEAEDYYNNNKERFRSKEMVHARYILFPLKKDAPEPEREEARKKAEDVLKLAKQGEDFAELAKKHSEAPNAEKGGDLGYFPRGVMVSDFDKQAFTLKVGEMSEVFETQFGFNILKVEDKKEEGFMPFDDIKAILIEMLSSKKMEEILNKKVESVKEQAKIEVLLEGF